MRALADFDAYWTNAVRSSGGTVDETDGLIMHTPNGGPPVNGILRYDGPTSNIPQIVAEWKAKGAPFTFTARTPEQMEACKAAGLEGQPAFTMIETPVRDAGAPEHEVLWDDVEPFVDAQMAAHDIPPMLRPMLVSGWQDSVDRGACRLMTVGNPAKGCAALFLGGGNAGLYAWGTLPEYRRQGIGSSLYKAAMKEAIRLGRTTVCAATTPDGKALALALGAEPGPIVQQFPWMPGP